MRPLLVIDGDSFAHRAYHALPKSIRRADRRPASALVGFSNMLIRLWEAEEPRTVLVAWDTLEVPTYRHQAFESYQSGREFDAELLEQLALLPDLVASYGFAVAKGDGFEADDFLAAAADAETERGGQALVATSDRDAFQLASENVTILQPTRGVSEIARIGPAEVRERYGVEPAQVPDFIALRGDPSDKLPGARGVGPEDGGAGPRRVRLARRGTRRWEVRRGGGRAPPVPARSRSSTTPPRCPPVEDRQPDWTEAAQLAASWASERWPGAWRRGTKHRSRKPRGAARLHPTGRIPSRPSGWRCCSRRWNAGTSRGRQRTRTSCAATTAAYVERIREISGPTWLDPDTVASQTSYEAALLSAGAAIEAVKQDAFALGRPPGHHALRRTLDGLLPVQQRRGGGAVRAGRAGRRARRDRRLGRPPRQRDAGHLLGRPERVLRLAAPVAVLSRNRWARRAERDDAERPAPRRLGRRRLRRRVRGEGRARRRGLRPRAASSSPPASTPTGRPARDDGSDRGRLPRACPPLRRARPPVRRRARGRVQPRDAAAASCTRPWRAAFSAEFV